jgi:1,5-anhydro-D-fructose reductase (1,5-anhydro-D-mannitol-forming)
MSSKHRQVRWGLIGASDIAQTRMLPAIKSLGGVAQIVVSGSLQRAEEFGARNGVARASAVLADAWRDDVDCVYISSKNELHFEQTMAALESGKHVLVEKPMALTGQDGQSMVDLAAAKGLQLAVNHHLPGTVLHRQARELVAGGAIGTVYSARIQHTFLLSERLRGWRLIGSEPGAGVILDITGHDASVLNPLLGTPERVTALPVRQRDWGSGSNQALDAAMTVIEYRGVEGQQILAQTHDSFTIPFHHTSLEVYGSDGSLAVADAMEQDSEGIIAVHDESGHRIINVRAHKDPYGEVVAGFVAAVYNAALPTVSADQGLLALKVALAAQKSAETGVTVSVNGA